jgi:hypothetical protein
MVMGAVITMVGGTGIFAVFSDRAEIATNSTYSGPRPHAADIQVAQGSLAGSALTCGPFSDDLGHGLWAVEDLQPGDSLTQYACIKNVGAAPLAISMAISWIAIADDTCTGDEATVDNTCGQGGGHGTIQNFLTLTALPTDCGNAGATLAGATTTLASLAANGVSLNADPINPDHTGCLTLTVNYPASTAEADVQAAQSDNVAWDLAIDATAQ